MSPVARLDSLARACIGLFALSTAFPVVAGVINADAPPRWLGVADVVVAAVLFVVAVIVVTRTRSLIRDDHRLSAFRASQRVIGVLPALLVVFFVFGARIDWMVLVIGLAWRAWLLFYTLPALAAAVDRRSEPDTSS